MILLYDDNVDDGEEGDDVDDECWDSDGGDQHFPIRFTIVMAVTMLVVATVFHGGNSLLRGQV